MISDSPRITATFYTDGQTIITIAGVFKRYSTSEQAMREVANLATPDNLGRPLIVRVLSANGRRIELVATTERTFYDESSPGWRYTPEQIGTLVTALAAVIEEPAPGPVAPGRRAAGMLLGPDPLLSPLPPA
ncbi:hypothetical protein [Aeromicrobium sp. IC_218]|uniref:hypothetical protein n=1 Tax=Aeromicrobium sp. IC_218 TaxID=2545468 RepID=UPI0010405E8C|nr:hypothetical protein [Aeromicrobium sp. IC_218]TCI96412.1 hypothetical protein E0W78_14865 [Aeromicrobium sp. IC_218]